MPQYQDFGFQLPPRLEAVPQHADEKEANCNHVTIVFLLTASQGDGVFGSDTGPGARPTTLCTRKSSTGAGRTRRFWPVGAAAAEHAPSSILISISARRRDLYDSRRRFFHGGAGTYSHRHCPVFV